MESPGWFQVALAHRPGEPRFTRLSKSERTSRGGIPKEGSVRTSEKRSRGITSLCSFLKSISTPCQEPLGETRLSPLDWYSIACSEQGPTSQQIKDLQTFEGKLDSFQKGKFYEFRVLRILEEMKAEGLIDDLITDYVLPRNGLGARQNGTCLGNDRELDDKKIDVLIVKKTDDGFYKYLPIQIKAKRRTDRGNCRIVLDKLKALALKKRCSSLSDWRFQFLDNGQVYLKIKSHYCNVYLEDEIKSDADSLVTKFSITKSEVRKRILEDLNNPVKTFITKIAINNFDEISLLEILFSKGLLEVVSQK